MPTYQYSCTECGHFFEQVQSFSDDALTSCPACEGRLRKVFNAVGVVFKGSGFYRTDSRTDKRTDSSTRSTEPSPAKEKPAAAPASAGGESGSKAKAKPSASESAA